jgi:hypothetical protein
MIRTEIYTKNVWIMVEQSRFGIQQRKSYQSNPFSATIPERRREKMCVSSQMRPKHLTLILFIYFNIILPVMSKVSEML